MIVLHLFLLLSSPTYALENASSFQKMWHKRDLNNTTTTAILKLEAHSVKNADDFDLHWNLARFYYWAASEANDSDQAAQLSKKGWDAAEAAKKIRPDRIEGWYWATANIGRYADSAGTFVTVKEGLSSHYENNAQQAIKIDPLYDDGGPYRSLGIYYTKLPWPMQDLDRARELIDLSLKENPKRALSLYHYANIQTQAGEANAAQKTLESILTLVPEEGNAPEIRRYQALAHQQLKSNQ
ncbi:MAG: hypothetical protein CMK59_07105 [Proteobacteria bacterium]|nr:hypothetical protein [Pseudomonadota bacterium]